ncbi:MAG: hypothetical protein AAGB22_03490, partial [Bacteroidota bacterium]
MKFLKVTAWVTGITLAVLAIAGWVVTSLYEDEVKAILLQRINDRLATEVQVQELELSIWKTFPYAALEFNGITADEYQEESAVADTLFHFDQLYLQFSLKDLWKEDYRIEKVLARGGFLDLRIEANGADNYHIWKPSSDTSSSGEFLFELENVTTENVRITYRHLGKEEHIGFDAEEATLRGRFSDTRYELAITAATGIRAFRIGKTDYGAGRDAELSVLLDIDREADTYTIREGELVIDDLLHFGINGALLEDGLDLTFTGDNLDLLATRTLLPATVQKPLENYRSEGVLDFELRMVGAFSRKDYPAMTATFGIRNGAIEHRATGHELTGISLNGSYTNGKRHRAASSRLEIDTISARLGEGTINGQFVLQNFERPQVRLDAQTAFALEDWREFLNLDQFETLSGQVEADVQYSGKLKAPDQLTADDLDRMKGSGTIRLQDAHFVLKGQDR